MSSLKRNFHKRPEVSYDIQVEQRMDLLKSLEQELDSWCTYDCYYCDCGIPCPENEPCYINMVKLCNKVESLIHKDEDGDIEDYMNEYKVNIN